MAIKKKKNVTLDDLALMVVEGFASIAERMVTKDDIAVLTGRIDKVETRMEKLEHKMEALDSSVKNYLELSDKRYLELREVNRVIFKYLKLIVQKTKTPLDLTELEKFVK